MPKRAILIGYKNMLAGSSDLIAKMRQNYPNAAVCQFDQRAERGFKVAMQICKPDDPLKIFILGHGGNGLYFITDDTRKRQQSLEDLTKLLKAGLDKRCNWPPASQYTEINMLACQFGRAPGGRVYDSPAVKLHRSLMSNGIFVNLVARTESISNNPQGQRITLYPEKDAYYSANKVKIPNSAYSRKANYTKILCTFRDNEPIIRIRDYAKGEWIATASIKGLRIVWADKVIDILMKNIQLDKGGTASNERQGALDKLAIAYGRSRDPTGLKGDMEDLLKDARFTSHRSEFSKLFNSDSLPATAQIVKDLLTEYPNTPYDSY
jgi:hypothetical protein